MHSLVQTDRFSVLYPIPFFLPCDGADMVFEPRFSIKKMPLNVDTAKAPVNKRYPMDENDLNRSLSSGNARCVANKTNTPITALIIPSTYTPSICIFKKCNFTHY